MTYYYNVHTLLTKQQTKKNNRQNCYLQKKNCVLFYRKNLLNVLSSISCNSSCSVQWTANPTSRFCETVDLRQVLISFSFENVLSTDATLTQSVRVILRVTRTLGKLLITFLVVMQDNISFGLCPLGSGNKEESTNSS